MASPSLHLGALTAADCEQLRTWRNADLSGLRTPFFLSEAMQADFYREVVSNRLSPHRYVAVRVDDGFNADDGSLVAVPGLTYIQWENRIAEISLIVNPSRRGEGLGQACADLILRYAFETLNLQTVFGECYACNADAERFWLQWTDSHQGDVTYLPNRKFWAGRYWNSLYFSVSQREEPLIPSGSGQQLAVDIANGVSDG